MERTVANSEARIEESLGERLNHLEQAQGNFAGASEETLKALAARFEAEAERNENLFSEFRNYLETMEGNLARLELQIADAAKNGISLYDQAKKKEAEALRGVVEDLMEQGSIREAIELHWNKKKV